MAAIASIVWAGLAVLGLLGYEPSTWFVALSFGLLSYKLALEVFENKGDG